jgi:hypothetical protein
MRIRSLVIAAAGAALMFPAVAVARISAGMNRNGPVVNSTFAGYGQNNSAQSSYKVTATFVVPTLKCGASKSAFFPNVGVQANWAGLFLGCSKHKQHAWPSVAAGNVSRNYRSSVVKAGDTVVLTVSANASKSTATVVDKTRKFKKQFSGTGSTSLSDPWTGANTWSVNEPIPNFGTLKFTNDLVNGQPFGSWPGGKTRWTMETTSNQVVKSSPFSGGGKVFTCTTATYRERARLGHRAGGDRGALKRPRPRGRRPPRPLAARATPAAASNPAPARLETPPAGGRTSSARQGGPSP